MIIKLKELSATKGASKMRKTHNYLLLQADFDNLIDAIIKTTHTKEEIKQGIQNAKEIFYTLQNEENIYDFIYYYLCENYDLEFLSFDVISY